MTPEQTSKLDTLNDIVRKMRQVLALGTLTEGERRTINECIADISELREDIKNDTDNT